MSVILVFLAVIACISGWWLAQQRLASKPWLERGPATALPQGDAGGIPTAKIGLAVLLAVIGCLFALLASAFFMRMEFADWRAPPVPSLLWLNTAILAMSSAAMHLAVQAARSGRLESTRWALVAAGAASLAFLAGQLVVWQRLSASGYLVETNPANSFFYLLTGMHGLHIVGGLVALLRTTVTAWSGEAVARLRLGVELCAIYWHFLLIVWLALFVLLAGWAGDFIAICRQAFG